MKKGLTYAFLIFIMDQMSKLYIAWVLMPGRNSVEITGFFNIVNVRNKGISFSFFNSDNELIQYILIAVITGIIVWLLLWLHKEKDGRVILALGFIVGGAFGNLLDRFTYGAVVDFLDFHIGDMHWPAFNLADSFICIGALLLAWRTILTPFKEVKV